VAIDEALALVRSNPNLPVPLNLRNAPTKLMKELGYGENYDYAHAHPGNFVQHEFMPEALKGHAFYKAGQNAKEQQIQQWLRERWGDKYEGQ
jgi:putative ATPase